MWQHIYRCLLNFAVVRAHGVCSKSPLKPHSVQMLSWHLHFFPFSECFSVSSEPVQRTSASQSSWVWSALLKVMLTVRVEGGDSMSPSFPALRLSSLPGDLNWWLSSFKSILKTTAAAVTLQNAEVGYKTDCDRLIWTAETRAFLQHHHHCLITSWFQLTTNWKRQQLRSWRLLRCCIWPLRYWESSSVGLIIWSETISTVTLM